MRFETLGFEGAFGDRLSGRLDSPDNGAPHHYAVFAHCFTCTKNFKAAGNISRSLTDEGFAVFRFDFTGLGESEGDFADTNFSSNVEDLVAAAQFLQKNHRPPVLLIGHSLGGAAVIQAAARIPSTAAVATIAAPSDPGSVVRRMGTARDRIEKTGSGEVSIGGRMFKIKKQFLEDLAQSHMEKALRELNRALLIFHSPGDDIVGIDNAARIFQAARHPKSFISLDRADHLLADPKDSLYAGRLIAVWAKRYIGNRKMV